MLLLDPIGAPSGREQVSLRPAWRVQLDDGTVTWGFAELRSGQVWITGYPMYPVELVRQTGQPVAGAIVGMGTGALMGAALGGPAGALAGGMIGLVLGTAASGSVRR